MKYVLGILALAGVSLLMAALILWGERTNNYSLGGAALGAILLAYGVIVLLLRKAGYIGPRKAEGREGTAR